MQDRKRNKVDNERLFVVSLEKFFSSGCTFSKNRYSLLFSKLCKRFSREKEKKTAFKG